MPVMTPPKKRSGRPLSKLKKKPLNITLTPIVFETLEEFRKGGEFKIERSEVIERALIDYFIAKGVLPDPNKAE